MEIKWHNKFFILFTVLLGSGCATGPIQVPNYEGSPSAYVSDAHVSSFTEIAASDHLVKNSQVYLSGKQALGAQLGLLGVAIDKSRNATLKKGKKNVFSIKFDEIVMRSIESQKQRINYVESPENADIIAIPSVRLESDKQGSGTATFRLAVRFFDPETRKKKTKNYFYRLNKTAPLHGENSWSENNAKLLRDQSVVIFDKLISFLVSDINNRYLSSEGLPQTSDGLLYFY